MRLYVLNTSTALMSSEFSLTIALVVFVMLTAMLLGFIILLFTNRGFRELLFHEKKEEEPKKKPKPEKKKEPQPEKQEKAEKTQPRRTSQKRSSVDDYSDGVPTVPLNFAPAATTSNSPRKSERTRTGRDQSPSTLDHIPTVVLNTPSANDGAQARTRAGSPKKATGKTDKK